VQGNSLTEPENLRERLETLEDTQRATINVLEDFDEERRKYQLIQKATLNLLEDMDEERSKSGDTQRATLNILEDFDAEKAKLQMLQRATINVLEDFNEERRKYQLIQKATLNLLEDMDEERSKLGDTQRALLNMLEDIEVERIKVEGAKLLAESANKELEAFSYSVSHDLRAPLRAISGFSQAVMEDYAPRLDDEGKRYLGLIQENAHRMGRLIDDLLTFSRLGRQQMTESEIDMGSLAKSVFDELSTQEPGRKIKFTIKPSPPVSGDHSMIRQVIANLLSNAVKFTRTREEAQIEFGYLPELGDGAYYIKDNGVGFDMQYVGKLFGVFQRLHSISEFEGTGVGLALVYRIVTRHGGRVWAEGIVNQGATFYFTLPRSQ
jgi:two-component system sensor kinase